MGTKTSVRTKASASANLGTVIKRMALMEDVRSNRCLRHYGKTVQK